ncbi:MAG TPA: hypothetical protein VII91_06310 [Bauldia sp.]
MIVNAYLSRDHFDDRDGSCPLIALPSDVSRGADSVKAAFRQVMEMMVGAFAANLEPGDAPERERALALVAMVVGGMVLARSVDDDDLAAELRDSTRKQAFALSGLEE